jgi:hypothetical protein
MIALGKECTGNHVHSLWWGTVSQRRGIELNVREGVEHLYNGAATELLFILTG